MRAVSTTKHTLLRALGSLALHRPLGSTDPHDTGLGWDCTDNILQNFDKCFFVGPGKRIRCDTYLDKA